MRRSYLVAIVVCLPTGVVAPGAWAQEGASLGKPDWSRSLIAGPHARLADIRLPRLSAHYPSMPDLRGFAFASRPLAVTPATADAWSSGCGNWSLAANWTAGGPTGSSAVTIGNTSGVTVTEDLASASAASLLIVNSNTLSIASGNTLTVGSGMDVSSGASLQVGTGSGVGSVLNSGGSLANSGNLQVGNYYMT